MGLGGHEAAATASDATPNVGPSVQVIEDGVGGVGARGRYGSAWGGGIEANEGLAIGGGEGNAPLGDGGK